MSAAVSPEKRIFTEALTLPPSERAIFLDQACASNRTLRKSLEELLQSHDEASRFLESQPDYPPVRQSSGTVMSPTEKISESGCATK